MFSNPFASSSEAPRPPAEDEQSLTSILSTPEDRSSLTLLVAHCTESMRKAITDTFDASQTGKPADIVTDLTSGDGLDNPNLDTSNVDVAAHDRAREERARREKELSAPKMTELREASLQYFDEWRDNVLQRVGEVVNSRETAKAQKHEAKAASPRVPSRPIIEAEGYDEGVAIALHALYPPFDTSLARFEKDQRALILHSMLLLLLSLEHYSAYSRILLLYLTSSLRLTIDFLAGDESKVAKGLLAGAEKMSAEEETKKKAEENAGSRKWKVGLASVAGAAIIGVTGGLAAPLLAAGVGSVMGGLGLGATAAAGYLGTVASSTVIVGGLFGAYGGRMTGQMMDQYAKEVEDFAFIPVVNHHRPRKIEKEYRRLRVAVGISGWLTEKDEVVEPWKVLGKGQEAFALRWELEALLSLGNAITTMIKSTAWGYAKSELIKRTVFASLSAALWPLSLLKVSRIIDNPFRVAKARSEKAGEVLADALINKAQGERPVTLIGYSLGARVIYTCLTKLAERKAFGLIESVVLIGAPTPSDAADWRRMRSVVAGRVVNVYSTNDYILGFLYRSSSIQYGVAGLQAIEGVTGVQNVDVSDLVSGHTRYRYLTGSILKKIGFEDIELEEVHLEEEALREADRREEEQRQERAKKESAMNPDEEVKDMEKEVEERN
ncbi:hypothetical protein B0A49_12606 [Cryomyces minteri]|uniref:DUF726-domain-containing protein n=1 Tax=Cryomyces minteri TaxID=331657 RepID=A0A4U0WMH1_9PEZI|nr:hypothetical protein B0A49_12606 [Cryomyces minteri]